MTVGGNGVHQVLFTPWRYAYITGQDKDSLPRDEGCFFCAAAQDGGDVDHLVVHRSDHHLVMLNRHPYSSGHLMVAPFEHCAEPAECPEPARRELWEVVLLAREVLAGAYRPDGFNLGMNLGSAAGAGVPGHFHFHVVPRWQGDSNFMAVVGDVRLVPEDPHATCVRLRRLFAVAVEEESET